MDANDTSKKQPKGANEYRAALSSACDTPAIESQYKGLGFSKEQVVASLMADFKGLKEGVSVDDLALKNIFAFIKTEKNRAEYEKQAKEAMQSGELGIGPNKLPLFEDLKKVLRFPKDVWKAIMTGEYDPDKKEERHGGKINEQLEETDADLKVAEHRVYIQEVLAFEKKKSKLLPDMPKHLRVKFDKIIQALKIRPSEKVLVLSEGVIQEYEGYQLELKKSLLEDMNNLVSSVDTLDVSDEKSMLEFYKQYGILAAQGIKIPEETKAKLEELFTKNGYTQDRLEELAKKREIQDLTEEENKEYFLLCGSQMVLEPEKYENSLDYIRFAEKCDEKLQREAELSEPETPEVEESETPEVEEVEEPSVEGRKVVGSDVIKNQTEMDKLVKEFETLDFSDTTAAMIWIADYARLSSNGAKVPENVRKDMVQKFEENGYPSNTSYKLPRYIDLTEKGRAAYIMTCASRLIGGNGVIDEKTVGIEAEAIVLKRAPDKALPDEVLGVESYDPNKQGVDRNKQSDVDKILQEQIDKLMQEVDSVDFSNPDQALAWMTKFGKLASQMEAPADIDKAKLNDIFKESGINTREGAAKLYSPNTKNLAEAELWAVTIGAGRILQDGQFPNTNAMNRILEAKGIIEPAKGETTQNVETPTAEGPTVENAAPAQEPEELPEQGKNAVKKIATETFEHGYSDKDGRRITEEMRRDLHPELVEQLEAEEKRRQQEQEEFDEHDPMSKYANGR